MRGVGDAAGGARRGRASATRSRGSRSRRRCRHTGGWRCTARRSRRSRRTGRARTRPASRITPRPPTTPRRCCSTPPPPASGRRCSGPIARRPRSSPAHCATRADLPRARRAELLERRSYECYLTERHRRAPSTLAGSRSPSTARPAIACARATRTGGSSRLVWFRGENATAEDEARRAVELLEPLPPGRELAMAYSNLSQLRMLASDQPAASAWGERAIALAERLGETEIVVHALNNVGAAELEQGMEAGRRQARAQPRAGAGSRPRGARRPGLHEPRRGLRRGGRGTSAATATSMPGSRTAPSTTSTRGSCT